MNINEATREATSAGVAVSCVRKIGAAREITVGKLIVTHDGRGGKACWAIQGQDARDKGYVGTMVLKAVWMQTGKA